MSTLQTTNLKNAASASNNITLDTSGNVGIGTAAPSQKLTIADGTSANILLAGSTTNFVTYAYSGFAVSGTTSNTPWLFYTNNTERMRIDNSGNVGIGTAAPGSLLTVNGNLAFNSGFGSAAVAYGCRAWVNFNGTGTVAIRASGNVSSITDNNTGDYTVNFTTAMPDANYNTVGMSGSNNAATNGSGFSVSVAMNNASPFQYSASGVRVFTGVSNAAPSDNAYVLVSIFR